MAQGDRMLRAIARVLPREFRKRVFEPALDDLRVEEGLAPEDTRRGRIASRILFCLDCLRLGLPLFLWRRRRPTRLAMAIAIGLALVALANQRVRYAERRAVRESALLRP